MLRGLWIYIDNFLLFGCDSFLRSEKRVKIKRDMFSVSLSLSQPDKSIRHQRLSFIGIAKRYSSFFVCICSRARTAHCTTTATIRCVNQKRDRKEANRFFSSSLHIILIVWIWMNKRPYDNNNYYVRHEYILCNKRFINIYVCYISKRKPRKKLEKARKRLFS